MCGQISNQITRSNLKSFKRKKIKLFNQMSNLKSQFFVQILDLLFWQISSHISHGNVICKISRRKVDTWQYSMHQKRSISTGLE